MKPGAIFVTFTKGLTSSAFEVLERKRYKMSWGPATVFIHRRLNYDGKPAGEYRLNILPSDSKNYSDDDDFGQIQQDNDEDDESASEESEDEADDEINVEPAKPTNLKLNMTPVTSNQLSFYFNKFNRIYFKEQ